MERTFERSVLLSAARFILVRWAYKSMPTAAEKPG